MKEKLKNFFKWIVDECKDKNTIILFLIIVILMYFPVWGGYSLYFIFKWQWCIAAASAYLVFWAGPFTPFFPLCMAITLGIKGIVEKILKKDKEKEEEKEEEATDS